MIELPSWDALPGDAARCLERIEAWTHTLRDHGVIAAFSEASSQELSKLTGASLVDGLEEFASSFWDFRGGLERNLAISPDLSIRQKAQLEDAALTLGLLGTPPPKRGEYDAVVMTGGMVRAGIVKPRFARQLFDQGIDWKQAVFLGGFRAFAGDELALAPLLGVTGSNEFDAMVVGMRLAFGLGNPDAIISSAGDSAGAAANATGNSAWRIDSWRWRGRDIRVVAAPSSDPANRRANTVDTYRFFAERSRDLKSVLVVTTPVYVPYQGAGAIEVLGIEHGISVETVAVSAAASDLGVHSQQFLPQHLAQELRSAVHGMRSLRARLLDASLSA